MSGVDRRFNDLPSTDDVARFLEAIKSLMQTRDPQVRTVGDLLDKFVTRRELVDLGLVSYESQRLATGGAVDLSVPPPPLGFNVVGGTGGTILTWIAAGYTAGGGNAYTEILAADYSGTGPLPTIASAVVVGSVLGAGALFVDARPIEVARHYWIRFTTQNGVTGPAAGGLNGVNLAAVIAEEPLYTIALEGSRLTTSTTTVPVAGLSVPLAAGRIYRVEGLLRVRVGGFSQDYVLGIQVPGTAICTVRASLNSSEGVVQSRFVDMDIGEAIGVMTFDPTFYVSLPEETYLLLEFDAIVIMGAADGELQVLHAVDPSGTAITQNGSTLVRTLITNRGPDTPPALATPPAGFTPHVDVDNSSTGAAVNPRLTLSMLSNGSWSVSDPSGVIDTGNWCTVPSYGVGNGFEVQFVASGSAGVGTVSNQAGTWTRLNANRSITFSAYGPPLTSVADSLTVQIRMRPFGGGTVTTLATTTLGLSGTSS